jgi:hypothetical protein
MRGHAFALFLFVMLAGACQGEGGQPRERKDASSLAAFDARGPDDAVADAGVRPDVFVDGDAAGELDALPGADSGSHFVGSAAASTGYAANRSFRLRGSMQGSTGKAENREIKLRGHFGPSEPR